MTSKESRKAPPRRFENYILTRTVDPSVGLSTVSDSLLVQVDGPTTYRSSDTYQGAGAALTDDAVSNVTNIGFDFKLDGVTYKQWVVSTNGWLALVDPASGSFTSSEVFKTTDTFANSNIKPTFTSSAVLLCPWFDNLRNSASTEGQLSGVPFSYSSSKYTRFRAGLETPSAFVNASAFGISYYTETNSSQGRRLIVRWASLSDHTSPSSFIKFEVVIYENGTIEYRYAPRSMISTPVTIEGATIGIFMPNGTNRFRDCSAGLGYRDGARQEYIYGGYSYVATYLDSPISGSEDYSLGYTTAVPYSINLLPYKHWPALNTGCIIRLSPPKSRRKIFPRTLIRTLDADIRLPQGRRVASDGQITNRAFDDRRSPSYTATKAIVNYPTTMPRFFGGNGLGVSERQDLFTGDMLVTGSVVKSAIDQYVSEPSKQLITPFNETRTPEQTRTTDPFYLTGSSSDHLPEGFDQKLRSKTIVRFVLPVQYTTTMPGTTSSIYYYNFTSKTWQVPARSTYILGSTGSQPPSPNPYAGGDWTNSITDVIGGRFIEDSKGFGPVGNVISSGSNTPALVSEQTDSNIGATYNYQTFAKAVSRSYAKSVRNNPEYAPNNNESFTIPINDSFLLEKAVFEVPVSFGPGWFSDKTTCFSPLGANTSFDFAGPALTLALMRQVPLSKTQPQLSVRDLIMTGTITHQADTTASLVLSNFPPDDTVYQLRPQGFNAYGGPPSVIVNTPTNQLFTGSVVVPMVAATSAGAMLRFIKDFSVGTTGTLAAQIKSFMATPTIPLADSSAAPATSIRYFSISPMGRGGLTLQPAGRSIFGNEFMTLQGLVDPTGKTFANPFFTSSLSSQHAALLNNPPTGSFTARATSVIPLVTNYPSPYLLTPNDRLVLSISKTRPAVYKYGDVTMQTSGSISHDVRLIRGRIFVTLYGSQVQAGLERHDVSSQAVGSDVIHEIVGGNPVLDQFESAYRNEYTSSFTDNVMLGKLTTTTTRDRKLSKLGARTAPALTTNYADTLINPYKSFRVQQWWERDSSVRHVQFIDLSERYWDSMMPSLKDCFQADGCGIFIAPPGTFGDFRQVDAGATGSIATFNPKKNRPGWIFMDNANPLLEAAGYGSVINGNWNKSFPFEPRYQGISRQLDVGKSLVATYIYQPFSSPVIVPITPTPVEGLIFGTMGLGTAVVNFTNFGIGLSYARNTPMYEWFVDSNLTSKSTNSTVTPTIPSAMYRTGSMDTNNSNQVLFGFGDRNTAYQITNLDSSQSLLGTNHFPDSRDVEGPHPDGYQTYYDTNNFRYSPRIRGWKYGVHSGNPSYSKAYWRRGRFGQFRDMLEQRPFTKYFQVQASGSSVSSQQGVQPAAVTVTFLDPSTGRLTAPDNTWSSNLHFECTSSLPFFDGVPSNRPSIQVETLNLHPNLVKRDSFGNIHIA